MLLALLFGEGFAASIVVWKGLPCYCSFVDDRDSSVGSGCDWNARGKADMGLSPCCGRGFFSRSQLSVETLTASVQPLCAVACVRICVNVKNPKHQQPYHCLDTPKHYTHRQEWVAPLLQLLQAYPQRTKKYSKNKVKK